MTTPDETGHELRLQGWLVWPVLVATGTLAVGGGVVLAAGATSWGAVLGVLAVGCLSWAVAIRRRYVVLDDGGVRFRTVLRRHRLDWEDVEQLAIDAGGPDRRVELTTSTGTVRMPALPHHDDTVLLTEAFRRTVADAPAPRPHRLAVRGVVISRTSPVADRTMPLVPGPFRFFVGAGGAIALIAVALVVVEPTRWQGYSNLLLGLLWLAMGLLPRYQYVRVGSEGLTYRDPRRRHWSWDEVADMTVDPAGGPRSIRLHLVSGRTVRLGALRYDRDTVAVEEAFRAAKARRETATDDAVTS